jgi:hypothetical protein
MFVSRSLPRRVEVPRYRWVSRTWRMRCVNNSSLLLRWLRWSTRCWPSSAIRLRTLRWGVNNRWGVVRWCHVFLCWGADLWGAALRFDERRPLVALCVPFGISQELPELLFGYLQFHNQLFRLICAVFAIVTTTKSSRRSPGFVMV